MDTHYDSAGMMIIVGNRVRFRGQEYIIKAFGPVEDHYGVATIEFEEKCHTTETPHECNIDLVSES